MRLPRLCLCTICTLASTLFSTHANPVGGVVVPGSGAASFSSSLGNLTINQTTPKVIINWQDFSIRAGEVTRFIQPSSRAAALNRVTAANPSQIYGTLQANGTVYLINPNGILVGRSGQIRAGSFMASTLDLGPDQESANASFLAGAGLHLSGPSTATVRNEGYISALDDVFLVAHSVENAGSIRGHTVGVAAGADIELRQSGSERISVIAGNSQARPGASDGVINSGEISSVTAELHAAGGNIYALAINNGGIVRATSIVRENGRILLRSDRGTVVNSGTLDASGKAAGAKGGEVQVLGQRVGLTGTSKIDVSGDAGGGTVLVGGDFQGKNPNVPNAERTIVAQGATIKADALKSGDGGKVIVWSDEATRYLAEISARGAGAGKGGFVEVSGKQSLAFDGKVDVSGSTPGTVLLDPKTITIAASNPDINGNGTTGDDIAALTDLDSAAGDFPGQNSVITAGAVNSLLTGNANLVLAAADSTTVNAAITGSGNASLRLDSPTVNLNAPITLAGSGVLSGTPTLVNVGAGGRIQNGVDVAAVGGIVDVAAGTYAENISVAKGLTLQGAKHGVDARTRNTSSGESIIQGQVTLSAPNTTLDGFTVQDSTGGAGIVANNAAGDRIINNYITANVFGLSLASDGTSQILVQHNFFDNNTRAGSASGNGIYTDFTVSKVLVDANRFQGQPEGSVTFLGTATSTISDIDIRNNTISGDGPISIGNIANVTITRNSISGNSGHAIWVGGGATTVSITENLVQNNAGAGLKFARPGSSGIAAGSSGFTVIGNAFSGNADGAIVIDTTEGSRYAGTLNASGNWWGSASGPNVASVGFAGSGDLIIDTAGPNDRVDFSPWLNSANNTMGAGLPGFLGDFSVLNVSPLSPKFNAQGYIDEALGSLTGSGRRLQLFAGLYNDQAIINIPATAGVVLKGDVTLDASTSINFGSTVDADGTARELVLTTPAATFGGAVGNAGAGAELGRLRVTGTSRINGGIVKTRAAGAATGSQNYLGTVTLGADTTLSGVGVTLAGVSSDNGSRNLAVNASGVTTFNGSVSGVGALTTDAPGNTVVNQTVNAGSVAFSDPALLNGGTITTSGSQSYNAAVTLGVDTILDNTTVSFGSTVIGAGHDLTLNSSGATTINGPSILNVARFRTSAAGSTRINGGSLNANTLIDIGDQLILGANTILAAPTVTLAGITGGGNHLAVNASGVTTFNGVVDGVNALSTDAFGSTVVNRPIINGGSVSLDDQATLNGGTITTSGSQAYNNIVTLGADTILNNATVTFGSTVDAAGHDLTLNSSGDITLNGPSFGNLRRLITSTPGSTTIDGGLLNASTLIDIRDQLFLALDTTLTAQAVTLGRVTGLDHNLNINASGVTTLNGLIDGVNNLRSDSFGSTTINASTITTSGNQNYGDAVTLGADVTLSGVDITLAAVSGAHNLTVNASGVTTFNGQVNGVGALVTDQPGSTVINQTVSAGSVVLNDPATLNGGTVTTSGDQDYRNSVTLALNTVLSGANISLAGVTGGGHDLQINSGGLTTFAGLVDGVRDLTTDLPGSTVINTGSIKTSGNQDYRDSVTLGADATLSSDANITLAAITGAGRDLTLNSPGLTTLGGGIAGVRNLRTDGPGTTAINAGTVTTTGNQTYDDALTLGGDTTLNNVVVSFGSTITGNDNELNLNSSGDIVLNGPSFINVGSLTIGAGGTTTLNGGSLTANRSINIDDQLILGANTILSALNAPAAVTLAAVNGAAHDLTVNASGLTTLGGVVSGVHDLTTDAAGTTTLNGGTVTTSGKQTYNDAVTLGANTTLNNTVVEFGSTVNGQGHDLTLNSSGDVTLNGPAFTGVGTLRTLAGGSTTLIGGSLSANTLIDIGDQLILGAINNLLNAPAVTLAGITGGGNNLTVNASGRTTFGGAVNGVDALITDAPGNTIINSTVSAGSVTVNDLAALNGGAVVTSADQNYNAAVTLGVGTTLNGANVTLASTVTGGNNDLAVNASVATIFGGPINGVRDLTTDSGGTTTINGGTVATTRHQTYGDAVTLGADTTLSGVNVRFGSTVAGATHNLAVNGSGVTTFDGAVSGVNALSSGGGGNTVINQTISAGSLALNEAATLNGVTITTSGNQAYNGAVTLGAGATLNGVDVDLASTVSGGGNNLTINASGITTFGGAVNGVGDLVTDAAGSTAIRGGTITTAGSQTYNDAVSLGAGTTLSGSDVTVGSTLSGSGHNLSVNSAGTTTFNGNVDTVGALTTDRPGRTIVNGTVGAGSVTLNDATTLNGPSITTSGSQTYGGRLTLGASPLLSGRDITFGGGVSGAGQALTLNASGDITQPSKGRGLELDDLFFTSLGKVELVSRDNRILHAEADCPTWNAGSFAISDSLSARFFSGSGPGSCTSIGFDEAFEKVISSLIPQIQIQSSQVLQAQMSAQTKSLAQGILTRSSELFVAPPSAVLTRSGDVQPEDKKRGN